MHMQSTAKTGSVIIAAALIFLPARASADNYTILNGKDVPETVDCGDTFDVTADVWGYSSCDSVIDTVNTSIEGTRLLLEIACLRAASPKVGTIAVLSDSYWPGENKCRWNWIPGFSTTYRHRHVQRLECDCAAPGESTDVSAEHLTSIPLLASPPPAAPVLTPSAVPSPTPLAAPTIAPPPGAALY